MNFFNQFDSRDEIAGRALVVSAVGNAALISDRVWQKQTK
jgi:hypothetical protein